jgi:acetoacetyl-CoA reductase
MRVALVTGGSSGILSAIPATPGEIARGVAFLVADESAFVNGITLSINGGKYMA